MQSSRGVSPAIAQNLRIKAEENSLFYALFTALDTGRVGQLTPTQAYSLFSSAAGLTQDKLKEIWSVATKGQIQNNIDIDSFYVACRLIAIAQNQHPISPQSLITFTDLPLPIFTGPASQFYRMINPAVAQQTSQTHAIFPQSVQGNLQPYATQNMASSYHTDSNIYHSMPQSGYSSSQGYSAQNPPNLLSTVDVKLNYSSWDLSDEERKVYKKLFLRADVNNDEKVDGKEYREFLKGSNFSPQVLRDLWILSDYDRDDKLNVNEFLVMMNLCMKLIKSYGKFILPTVLPEELKACAQGKVLASAEEVKAEREAKILAHTTKTSVLELKLKHENILSVKNKIEADIRLEKQQLQQLEHQHGEIRNSLQNCTQEITMEEIEVENLKKAVEDSVVSGGRRLEEASQNTTNLENLRNRALQLKEETEEFEILIREEDLAINSLDRELEFIRQRIEQTMELLETQKDIFTARKNQQELLEEQIEELNIKLSKKLESENFDRINPDGSSDGNIEFSDVPSKSCLPGPGLSNSSEQKERSVRLPSFSDIPAFLDSPTFGLSRADSGLHSSPFQVDERHVKSPSIELTGISFLNEDPDFSDWVKNSQDNDKPGPAQTQSPESAPHPVSSREQAGKILPADFQNPWAENFDNVDISSSANPFIGDPGKISSLEHLELDRPIISPGLRRRPSSPRKLAPQLSFPEIF